MMELLWVKVRNVNLLLFFGQLHLRIIHGIQIIRVVKDRARQAIWILVSWHAPFVHEHRELGEQVSGYGYPHLFFVHSLVWFSFSTGMSNPLTTTFDAGPAQAVAVALDMAAAARKRARDRLAERLAEARELEKFGNRVMRVKIKALAAIGADVEKMGVKQKGHGMIAIAGDMAHVAVEHLVDLVHDLRTREKPCEPEVIVAAMKEMRAFNQQLMDSGKAHIEADKQVVQGHTGTNISFPFPAGTPLVVGIAPQKPMQVEDSREGA